MNEESNRQTASRRVRSRQLVHKIVSQHDLSPKAKAVRDKNVRRIHRQVRRAEKLLGERIPDHLMKRLLAGDSLPISSDLRRGLPAKVIHALDQPNSFGIRPSQLRRMYRVLGMEEGKARLHHFHLRGLQAGEPHPASEF